jgi:hypothetical protein
MIQSMLPLMRLLAPIETLEERFPATSDRRKDFVKNSKPEELDNRLLLVGRDVVGEKEKATCTIRNR